MSSTSDAIDSGHLVSHRELGSPSAFGRCAYLSSERATAIAWQTPLEVEPHQQIHEPLSPLVALPRHSRFSLSSPY